MFEKYRSWGIFINDEKLLYEKFFIYKNKQTEEMNIYEPFQSKEGVFNGMVEFQMVQF